MYLCSYTYVATHSIYSHVTIYSYQYFKSVTCVQDDSQVFSNLFGGKEIVRIFS